jgi:signal transduction histidine kinase
VHTKSPVVVDEQKPPLPAGGPRPATVIALAALGIALATGAALIAYHGAPRHPGVSATLHAALVLVPVSIGLAVLARGRRSRFALLLVISGFVWSVTALAETTDPVLYAIGRVSVWVVEPMLVYLLLAFPSGRLSTTLERRVVWAAVAIAAALYATTAPFVAAYPDPSPWTSCGVDCPDNGLAITTAPSTFIDDVVRPLREVVTALLFASVVALLVRRAKASGPLLRRALIPVIAIAVLRGALLVVYQIVRGADPTAASLEWMGWAYVLSLPLLALSFAAGLLLRRLHAGVALRRLAVRLPLSASHAELRDALAGALEDPTLEIIHWRPGNPGTWVDDSGWPVADPKLTPGRACTEVASQSRRIAAIVHDELQDQDEVVLRAAASYALVVLEHGRLVDRLRDSLRELSTSRARLVAIADETRRDIERNLHDGAQQKLIALRIRLSLESERLARTDPVEAEAVARLGEEAEEALDELRAMAHGIYPSVLAERGLPDALRAVARRAALPTIVDASGITRFPSEVENAVYFACLEALQNAEKHATGASHVAITLELGDVLAFEVLDDGPGLHDGDEGGSGFANLRDRLGAVGGTLVLGSGPDGGARVAGQVPVPAGAR